MSCQWLLSTVNVSYIQMSICMEFCLALKTASVVEFGHLRHPGASPIGSQHQSGDCTDGWQNLKTQP